MDNYQTELGEVVAVYCFKTGGAWYRYAAYKAKNLKNGAAMHEGYFVHLEHVTIEEIAQLYS